MLKLVFDSTFLLFGEFIKRPSFNSNALEDWALTLIHKKNGF